LNFDGQLFPQSQQFPLPMFQNQEAFEGGVIEKTVETKDTIATKHGIEKTGVDIRKV
jgi:hypothetical protein